MTKPQIVTELLTIKQVVQGKLFKVPDYQRGYSWDKSQVKDLIEDIGHIMHQNHKHYTGTIVISARKDGTPKRYDIVDGQQRLTTIIILLKCIYDLDPKKYVEIYDTFLVRDGQHYVLETNKETAEYFRQSTLGDANDNVPIKSLENLKKTKLLFKVWLKKEKANLDTIYNTVVSKLGFLCFAPNNTKEIGIMFEVINNRGKELSELEKIKNYFIYYATINNNSLLKQKVNDSWGHILAYLSKAKVVSNQDENNFLRNCYLVFFSANKSQSWHSYSHLKERYPADDNKDVSEKIKEITKFISFLKNAATNYAFFYRSGLFEDEFVLTEAQDPAIKKNITNSLKHLRCHPVNASIFPLYLAAMHYLNKNSAVVAEILNTIEILNFRTYVLPNPNVSRADSKQGDLFNWAYQLYQYPNYHSSEDEYEHYTYLGNLVEGDIFDSTLKQLQDFTRAMCSESIFVQSLTVDADESIDYYHWKGIRYFLAAYEEYKNAERKESWDIENILINRKTAGKDKENDYLSKEHIWASKNRKDKFPHNYIDKRRLGNFVLLGLGNNRDVSNWDIPKKVAFLVENNSVSMCQIDEVKSTLDIVKTITDGNHKQRKLSYWKELAKRLIDQRENELIKFALHRWAFPQENMNRFIEVNSFKAGSENRNESYYLQPEKKK